MTVRVADFEACIELVQEQMHENVEYLNSGGCAVFAAALLKRMRNAGIEDGGIVVFGDQYDDSRPNLEVLENDVIPSNDQTPYDFDAWRDNGISFAHVVVEWGGRYWDGYESFEDDVWRFWPRYDGYMSLETVEALANTPSWCPLFSRLDIPYIEQVLDDAFSCLTH